VLAGCRAAFMPCASQTDMRGEILSVVLVVEQASTSP
jgi:hypothetical protein